MYIQIGSACARVAASKFNNGKQVMFDKSREKELQERVEQQRQEGAVKRSLVSLIGTCQMIIGAAQQTLSGRYVKIPIRVYEAMIDNMKKAQEIANSD